MTYKRVVLPLLLLFLFAALALLLEGCQPAVEPDAEEAASPPATVEPSVTSEATALRPTETATAQATRASEATPTAEPSPTEEPPTGEPPAPEVTSLDEANITLDEASPLLQSVSVQTVPASQPLSDHAPRYLLQPAHTLLHLDGYPLARDYQTPTIAVYPAEAYVQLSLAAEQEIEHLQALLAAWPHPQPMPGADTLPYLPEPHAAQILYACAARLAFQNGSGIRYLTQYVQDVSPITNNSLLYTFQGLTDDGRFYVSATLPLSSDALPADTAAAQAQGFDSVSYNFDRVAYEAYLAEQQTLLEGLGDNAFTPDLATLDALLQSLDLSQYSGPDVDLWVHDVAPAPDQVVDDFLEAYVPAGGFPAGAHHDDPHLHPEFVAQIEATAAAFRQRGIEANTYDPVLMAVLGPPEVGYGFDGLKVGPATIDGNEATVLVERDWHYTLAVSPLRYTLRWNGEVGQNRWQITGVSSAGVSSNIMRAATEPERATERFFETMIAAAGQFEMPAQLLEHVDPALVTPDATVRLCYWVWPVGVAIEGSFVQPAPLHLSDNVAQEAYVVVHLPLKGGVLTTHLVRQRDSDAWQVRETICSDTPQGKTLAFYSWYLGEAAHAAAGGETRWAPRAPYIDTMNPVPAFTTERFRHQAEVTFQEDAYLPSGRAPDRFRIELGPRENVVLVYLEYLGETEATVETLQVTLQRQQGGEWLVDGVAPAP